MSDRPGQQGAKQIQALIRAGQELAGRGTLADLFPLILDLAIEGVGAQRGVVMTLEGDRLEVKANKGEGFRISSAVRDRVINEKASVLVRDAQLDEAFRERMSIVEQKVRTLMAVPLQTEKRTIGLIYVDSPNMFRAFTKDDLSLLTVMANVAAIRIEHARLSRNRGDRAPHGARAGAGGRDPAQFPAAAARRRWRAPIWPDTTPVPHGGRRLLRFFHLSERARGHGAGRRFRQGHAGFADDDGPAGARAGAGGRAAESGRGHQRG